MTDLKKKTDHIWSGIMMYGWDKKRFNKEITELLNISKIQIRTIDVRREIFEEETNEISEQLLTDIVFIGKINIIDEFISYWTEPNKSKTKMRFELERTWDTKRRLQTWIRNDKKFNPQNTVGGEKKKVVMEGNYLKGNHFKERVSNSNDSEPKKLSELIKK